MNEGRKKETKYKNEGKKRDIEGDSGTKIEPKKPRQE
jgi:hypothetical protein